MGRYIILRLEGPLMAFGGEVVDWRRVVVDFPGRSMLTGLIANALGWDRSETERHDAFQERITYGARIDRSGSRIQDFQTAQLSKGDRSWTTRGEVAGRGGGAETYDSPLIRVKEYDADKSVVVAIGLEPGEPSLDEVAEGISTPRRPLFIGRKACLPTKEVFAGIVEADSVRHALAGVPLPEEHDEVLRMLLPRKDGIGSKRDRFVRVTDERRWTSGFHSGSREVVMTHVAAKSLGEVAP